MKLNQGSAVVVMLVAMVSVAGCGTTRDPIIEDYVSADWNREIGTMASVASRRLTVVRLDDSKGSVVENSRWARGEFCSEPPPDAMVAVAEQWTAKLAELKGVEVDAQLVQSVASSMGPLVHRTQGLQWNRDSMAFACMDYINRRVDKTKYTEWIEDIREKSVKLILKELPKLPTATVDIGTVPAPRQKEEEPPPNEP